MLTPQSRRDLINSIADDGQRVAAIVRPVFDDAHFLYEIIAGSRRLAAVAQLRATTRPDLRLLVRVEMVDDEAAYRLADLDQRACLPLAPINRARSYARALDEIYSGDQGRMADQLQLGEDELAAMLMVARIPEPVVAAFAAPDDLTLDTALALARRSAEPDGLHLLATATQIAMAQAARRADGQPPYPADEVLRLLDPAAQAAAPTMTRGTPIRVEVTTLASRELVIRLTPRKAMSVKNYRLLIEAMLAGAGDAGFIVSLAEDDSDDPSP